MSKRPDARTVPGVGDPALRNTIAADKDNEHSDDTTGVRRPADEARQLLRVQEQDLARQRLRGYAQDRMFADYWRNYEAKFYSPRCGCDRRSA